MLAVLAQQQAMPELRAAPRMVPIGDAWQWWTLEHIASCCTSPVDSVRPNWPLVYAALQEFGIAQYEVCLGVLGTIAVETAHTFEPVREAYWLPESWRAANLRYYPWYGRGFVQLTWQSNYDAFGKHIGVDLISDPDLAMQPAIAARIMASFFVDNDIQTPCLARDWPEVRRRVQGADAGLDTLVQTISCLDTQRVH